MAPSDTPPCYRFRDVSSISKALMEGYRGYERRETAENDKDLHPQRSVMHSDPEGIPLSRHVDRQRHGGLEPNENVATSNAQPLELSRVVDRQRHGGKSLQGDLKAIGELTPPQSRDPFVRPEPAAENPGVLRLFSSPPFLGHGLGTSATVSPQIGPVPSQPPQPPQPFPTALSADSQFAGNGSWYGGQQVVRQASVHRQSSVGRQASLEPQVQVQGGPVSKSAMDLQAAWERHGFQKPLRQVCMSARDTINTDHRGALSPAPPALSPPPPLPPMPAAVPSTQIILPPPVQLGAASANTLTPRRELSYGGMPLLQRDANSFVAGGVGIPQPASARPPPQSSRGKSDSFMSRCRSITPRPGPHRQSYAASSTPPVSPMLGSCSPMPGGARSFAPSSSTPLIAPSVIRQNSFQPRLPVTPPPGNGLTREFSSTSIGVIGVPSYVPSPRPEERVARSTSLHSPAKVVRMRSAASSLPTPASPTVATPPVSAAPTRVMRKSMPIGGNNFSYKAPARCGYDGFNLQETAAAIKAALQASAAAQRMIIQSGLNGERAGLTEPALLSGSIYN